MEEDASKFTSYTTTPCDYNITKGVQNADTIWKENQKLFHQWEFIHRVNINIEMSGDSNILYHGFNNGDALTFKDKYTALLQQELQKPSW